jgi:ribosomal protein S27AE
LTGHGEGDPYEVPRFSGAYNIKPEELDRFRAFCAACGPAIARHEDDKALQRAAGHYRKATSQTWDADTVFGDERDVLLRYTIICEALVGGRDRQEIARTLSYRVAALCGDDEAQRLAIRTLMQEAYSARSSIVHGVKEKTARLALMRKLVARLILRYIALLEAQLQVSVVSLLDDSLLAESAREQAQQAISAFERQWSTDEQVSGVEKPVPGA